MYQLISIGHKDHHIEFRLPRSRFYNVLIKYELDRFISYEATEEYGGRPFNTTLVPLIVYEGVEKPMFWIETKHDFHLRRAKIVMIPEPVGYDWNTLSEIEAESKRMYDQDFPVRRRSSSVSISRVFTCNDENKPANETEAASLLVEAPVVPDPSASSSSASGEPPASKMPRSS